MTWPALRAMPNVRCSLFSIEAWYKVHVEPRVQACNSLVLGVQWQSKGAEERFTSC